MSKHKLFFIAARGRSGTDLLRSVLHQHPEIAVVPEAHHLVSMSPKYASVKKWPKKKLESFVEDLFEEEKFIHWWKLDKEKVRQTIFAHPPTTTFQELCMSVYECWLEVAGKDGVLWIGDKNPTYALFIGKLMKLFPESRTIILIRDYRANILSYQNVTFDLKGTAALGERWNYYNKILFKCKKRFPKRTHVLKYEDFLRDPKRTISEICRFLEIHFHPSMLEPQPVEEELQAWQSKLDKPIDGAYAEAWRKKIDPGDKLIADHVCRKVAKLWGYAPDNLKPGFFSRLSLIPGRMKGKFSNFAEIMIFMIPFRLQSWIMKRYRRKAKVLK